MRVGLDIGSTTIKCVVLDEHDQVIYDTYERHGSHITEKAQELLARLAKEKVPGGKAYLAISAPGWLRSDWLPRRTWSSSWAARTPRFCSSPAAPRCA